eukprot:CAMPEP_0177341272 /NCGR_PEP_ID=MMETSP0368-20130122/26413_1 /TAXON_ID=447022 ORGANISM="Scrippsiella hangoei-like, Strain SHHI-4" /NCGR_SAMPLE_ID=MMETSP0368 /ASSEMBLY_ACC=CAM_ASM_000363 /LENGTH=347 /DNA_ID=CAMNT_0018802545 /DNA_START=13 /DNA_END=1056 /DNA_ORIENTATION=-
MRLLQGRCWACVAVALLGYMDVVSGACEVKGFNWTQPVAEITYCGPISAQPGSNLHIVVTYEGARTRSVLVFLGSSKAVTFEAAALRINVSTFVVPGINFTVGIQAGMVANASGALGAAYSSQVLWLREPMDYTIDPSYLPPGSTGDTLLSKATEQSPVVVPGLGLETLVTAKVQPEAPGASVVRPASEMNPWIKVLLVVAVVFGVVGLGLLAAYEIRKQMKARRRKLKELRSKQRTEHKHRESHRSREKEEKGQKDDRQDEDARDKEEEDGEEDDEEKSKAALPFQRAKSFDALKIGIRPSAKGSKVHPDRSRSGFGSEGDDGAAAGAVLRGALGQDDPQPRQPEA